MSKRGFSEAVVAEDEADGVGQEVAETEVENWLRSREVNDGDIVESIENILMLDVCIHVIEVTCEEEEVVHGLVRRKKLLESVDELSRVGEDEFLTVSIVELAYVVADDDCQWCCNPLRCCNDGTSSPRVFVHFDGEIEEGKFRLTFARMFVDERGHVSIDVTCLFNEWCKTSSEVVYVGRSVEMLIEVRTKQLTLNFLVVELECENDRTEVLVCWFDDETLVIEVEQWWVKVRVLFVTSENGGSIVVCGGLISKRRRRKKKMLLKLTKLSTKATEEWEEIRLYWTWRVLRDVKKRRRFNRTFKPVVSPADSMFEVVEFGSCLAQDVLLSLLC